MHNMLPGDNVTTSLPEGIPGKQKRWPGRSHCSICQCSIWRRPIILRERFGDPADRRSWVLCAACHVALLRELRRSPVRSAMRVRIAMGIVASERSPEAHGSISHVRDQRRFMGIAWVLFIAMFLHLVAILVLVVISR